MSPQVQTHETKSPAGTIALGKRLARTLRAGDCVTLRGQLGSGKTVLVKGIAAGLGLTKTSAVTSPTFVLVHEYPGSVPIYHVDLYRLPPKEADLELLGIDEMLRSGVVVIEWADKAGEGLPRPRWEVRISITGPRTRRFEVRRIG